MDKPYIVTHNGGFHADDATAVAILRLLYPNMKLVRSREKSQFEKADICVDVGFRYDPENGYFDHHQKGGAAQYPDGFEMASAGIVWQYYGKRVIHRTLLEEHLKLSEEEENIIFERIAHQFIRSIDLFDTGACEISNDIVSLSECIESFNQVIIPGRRNVDVQDQFRAFLKAVKHMMFLIQQQILLGVSYVASASIVEAALVERKDPLVILHEKVDWKEHIYEQDKAQLKRLVIYPGNNRSWMSQVIPLHPQTFDSHIRLPENWGGLESSDLAAVCGVPDAIFCHSGCFCMAAGSLDGIINMSLIALKEI